MNDLIRQEFIKYVNTRANFDRFHNQVINMPRDDFSHAGLKKIQSLCAYLLLIEKDVDVIGGMNYKDFMSLIIKRLERGQHPHEHRNIELENRYFPIGNDINSLYDKQGRMFRHLMGLCAFSGIIKSNARQKKVIDFDVCREMVLSSQDILMPIMRNNLIGININSNDLIANLTGIDLSEIANYRPVYSILKYIRELGREATLFEISILLGRVDTEIQTENEILDRAYKVGKILPANQDEQMQIFFESMGWKNEEGVLYQYTPSQQPHFKFKACLLLMQAFDLIYINDNRAVVSLTDYSNKILAEEIPAELLDLQELLYRIDDDTEDNNDLFDVIIRKRTQFINYAITTDTTLVERINKRALRTIEYDRSGKRKRNRMISELAKIKAGYLCEATGKPTFKTPFGTNYVESHHIIEFSTEDGPDITENLIALGPEKHKLVHLACQKEIDDFYTHLLANGVINIDRFVKMHTIYNCLTVEHVQVLYNKKLISSIDKDNLTELISGESNNQNNLTQISGANYSYINDDTSRLVANKEIPYKN